MSFFTTSFYSYCESPQELCTPYRWFQMASPGPTISHLFCKKNLAFELSFCLISKFTKILATFLDILNCHPISYTDRNSQLLSSCNLGIVRHVSQCFVPDEVCRWILTTTAWRFDLRRVQRRIRSTHGLVFTHASWPVEANSPTNLEWHKILRNWSECSFS